MLENIRYTDILGFDRWNVEQRIKTANGHISQLYMQMQIEEREVLNTMKADLAAALTIIRELTSELGLPAYRYDGPPQLVLKFDHVKIKQKELERQKETAMTELHRLKSKFFRCSLSNRHFQTSRSDSANSLNMQALKCPSKSSRKSTISNKSSRTFTLWKSSSKRGSKSSES